MIAERGDLPKGTAGHSWRYPGAARAMLVLSLATASVVRSQSLATTLPASPPASGRLEDRPCRTQNATGQAIIACHSGLAGYSGGKSCLWGVTYVNGKEQPEYTGELCVRSCTQGNLTPDKGARCGAIYEEYKDSVTWRTLGDLSGEDRDALAALYGKLIPLVNTNSKAETRRWLKQEILKIVLRKMIPLRHDAAWNAAGGRANVDQFDVMDLFEDPDPANQPEDGFNPMGIRLDQHLYLYESAFLERTKGPTVRYTMRHPDQLALDLGHEMIHMLQEGSGYGDPRDMPSANMLAARVSLSELQAYHITLRMAQVKVMQQYGEPVPSDMPLKMEQQFKTVWADLDPAERRVLARWAWSLQDDWMRRQMYTAPDSDGGVWGDLCRANAGGGPCHMEN